MRCESLAQFNAQLTAQREDASVQELIRDNLDWVFEALAQHPEELQSTCASLATRISSTNQELTQGLTSLAHGILLPKTFQCKSFSQMGHRTARQAMEYAIGQGEKLTYADFSMTPISNYDLADLAKHCPNLRVLICAGSDALTGDVLSTLQAWRKLQVLDISGCTKLAPNSLRYVSEVPELKMLLCARCRQFESRSLENLEHLQGLRELNVQGCVGLSPDALKSLRHTPLLQKLNISGCNLEPNALQELEATAQLENLEMQECKTLSPDALSHIQPLRGTLRRLNVSLCTQLAKESCQHLHAFQRLRELELGYCSQLDLDPLAGLASLEHLSLLRCSQVKRLDFLRAVSLRTLNVKSCANIIPEEIESIKSRGVKITK